MLFINTFFELFHCREWNTFILFSLYTINFFIHLRFYQNLLVLVFIFDTLFISLKIRFTLVFALITCHWFRIFSLLSSIRTETRLDILFVRSVEELIIFPCLALILLAIPIILLWTLKLLYLLIHATCMDEIIIYFIFGVQLFFLFVFIRRGIVIRVHQVFKWESISF